MVPANTPPPLTVRVASVSPLFVTTPVPILTPGSSVLLNPEIMAENPFKSNAPLTMKDEFWLRAVGEPACNVEPGSTVVLPL